MTFRTIIKDEIKGNLPTYKEYFLASFFSVALIFATLLVLNHPQMELSSLSKNFVNAAKAVSLIIGVFLFLFIYYSQYTFLKHRSRDYALLSILGIKPRQLSLLNCCESLVVYLASFVSGVLIATLFGKLILMAFAKLLDIEQMDMYFPSQALWVTALIFGLIYIIIQTASLVVLHRTRVKDFLQFGVVAQKQKKVNYPIALIGILLLGTSYYLAASVTDDNILTRIIPVCLMAIVGMYCFYREACPLLLQRLSKNKRFYYKGVNMLWVSDLKYRIKDFTVILFLISVTMTVGLTGFSAVFNVATVELDIDTMSNSKYPVAVIKTVPYSDTVSQAALMPPECHSLSGVVKILDSLQINYHTSSACLYGTYLQDRLLIPHSYLPVFLEPDQMEILGIPGILSQTDTVLLDIKGSHLNLPLGYHKIYAVPDSKVDELTEGFDRMYLNIFSYNEKVNLGKEFTALNDFNYFNDSSETIMSSSLMRYFYFTVRRVYLFLSFYFVVIFYICAGCMLYFKFFNNAVEEGKKYANYSKVGLSVKEVRRSATIQMAALFFLPGILTVLNTGFAMLALINTDAPKTFLINTVVIILFTFVVQIIYFIFLRNRYIKRIETYETNMT